MSKKIHYGNQIYIEINNLKPHPNTEKRILCSSGFLQDSISAVKSSNFHHANFRNCLFVVHPGLVDATEDLHIVQSLRTQLEYLVACEKEDKLDKEDKNYKSGKKYVNNQLEIKKQQIELKGKHIEGLNKKIMDEMDNKPVNYTDVVILQHVESGYYLCADFAHHPQEHSLNNLHLQKDLSVGCYFKFFSYASALERGPLIHYESEMKLVSVYTNWAVTMALNADHFDFHGKDDLDVELGKQGFTKDMTRRPDIIKSFDNRNNNNGGNSPAKTANNRPISQEVNDYIVGTASDFTDNNRIRVYNFVTRTDLIDYGKRRGIKNGDYIRLHINEFYLTAYKNPNRESIGLFSQRTDNYAYNMVSSIFQVVKAFDHASHVYPLGSEIHTEPKEADAYHLQEGGVFLKHFATGDYLPSFNANSEKLEKLFVLNPYNSDEVPWFALVNSHLKGHAEPLTRNSRVNLKANGEQPYMESEIENQQNQAHTMLHPEKKKDGSQKEVRSSPEIGGYSGYVNPEDKIARHLSLMKKVITNKKGFDSYFKVSLVTDEEMQKIEEFESHAKSLRKFLVYVLNHREYVHIAPENEVSRVIEHTRKLADLIQPFDIQTQVICMEFKIIDMAAQLIYYFYGGNEDSATLKATVKSEQIVMLIKNLTDIIANSIAGNEFIHSYMSQYVKVFISCLLNFPNVSDRGTDQVKNNVVKLLRKFLLDKDTTTLQLFDEYAHEILDKVYKQTDYSTHLLRIVNHNSSTKAVNMTNKLRDTFIQVYMRDDEKRKRILPMLSLSSDDQVQITFTMGNEPVTVLFHEATFEQQQYMKWVFRFITTVAKRQALRFFHRMIEHYDGFLLIKLIQSNRTPLGLKAEILGALRMVHFSYTRLPFSLSDSKIHHLVSEPDQELRKLSTTFEQACLDTLILENIDSTKIREFMNTKFNIEESFVKLLNDHLSEIFPQLQNREQSPNRIRYRKMNTVLIEVNSASKIKTMTDDSSINLLNATERQTSAISPFLDFKDPPKKTKSMETKNINFVGSTLEVIEAFLEAREDISLDTLCQIKKFLCVLVEEAAKGQNSHETNYMKIFHRYAYKVFKSLIEVDKIVLNLSFKDFLAMPHDFTGTNQNLDSPKKKKAKTAKVNPSKTLKRATTIHVHHEYEWIQNSFSTLDFVYQWLEKKDAERKGTYQNVSIKSLEDGLLKSLWKLVSLGDKSLSNEAVATMEAKASLNKIYEEIYDYSFLRDEEEVSTLTQLMEHLLALMSISRKIQLRMNFQKGPESQQTLDQIINILERVMLIIYPFSRQMIREDSNLSTEEAERIYFKRFRESKHKGQEVPIVFDPRFLKVYYQKVLKVLKAPKILAPLLRYVSMEKEKAFKEVREQDVRYAYHLMIAIFRIFMQGRPDNQVILSEIPEIMTLFHNPKTIEEPVEAVEMFKELCRNDAIFVKMSGNSDFDFLTSYVKYIEKIQLFAPENTQKPEIISYLRGLNSVMSLQFTKDMVKVGDLMKEKLQSLENYLMNNKNAISLLAFLPKDDGLGEVDPYDVKQLSFSVDKVEVKFPIFRIIAKELLTAESQFALTKSKTEVTLMQRFFGLKTISSLVTNENIEFNFDLKQRVFEFFENLYFKSVHKRTSVFSNFDQFAKVVSILFVDAQEYIKANLQVLQGKRETEKDLSKSKINKGDRGRREIFRDDIPAFKECQALQLKYIKLRRSHIENVVFTEYQRHVKLKKVWKDYVYYILCKLFSTLISHFSGFFKERQQEYFAENIFEAWFRLLRKLYKTEPEENLRYREMIHKALEEAVDYGEYAEYRKKINKYIAKHKGSTVMGKNNTRRFGGKINAIDVDLAGVNIAGQVLNKGEGHEKNDDEYISRRLEMIYKSLENGSEVIQKLCKLLAAPETARKDKLFLLTFFAQTLKTENEDAKSLEIRKDRQNTLADLGIVEALFEVFSQYEDDKRVFYKIMLLSTALLKGGNRKIQDKFYASFKSDLDNEVFGYIISYLETLLESILASEKERTTTCYRRALNFVFDYLIKNKLAVGMVVAAKQVKEMIEKAYQQEIEKELESMGPDNFSVQKERELLSLILNFIQNLCEGHNSDFQEFFRDQTLGDHTHSYNVLEFLLQTYRVYHKHINTHNLEIGIQILDVIIEMEQSEIPTNTLVLLNKTFINDICATVNIHHVELDLLSRGFTFDPNSDDFLKLKLRALTVLKDLVEKLELPDLKKMRQFVDLQLLIAPLKENIIKFDHDKKKEGIKVNSPKDLDEDDMLNENLTCASMIYIILRHLSFDEGAETFSDDIHDAIHLSLEDDKENGKIVRRYLNHVFKEYTGAIEIFRAKSNKLIKIYFPTPVMYFYLKQERKNEFCDTVDRSSTQTKVSALMDAIAEFRSEMRLEYLPGWIFNRFPVNINSVFVGISVLTAVLALAVNYFNVFTLQYNADNEEIAYQQPDIDNKVQLWLNVAQSILSFVLLFRWLYAKRPTYLASQWSIYTKINCKRYGPILPDFAKQSSIKEGESNYGRLRRNFFRVRRILRLRGPHSLEYQSESQDNYFASVVLECYNIYFVTRCFEFWWLFVYLGVCVGSYFHPLITAFQLFDLLVRSDTVARIMRAIYKNYKQFIWTFLLLSATIYVYTLIGFYFLHNRFQDDDGGDLCSDTFSCFLINFNNGLRSGGGIADSMQTVPYNSDSKWHFLINTVFDLSFFILMITLLLNLIFGMIIDAFGELRDQKTSNDDDVANVCFVCGLTRSEYERTANFDKHIEEEHNMWQYVAYIVFLIDKREKTPEDLNDIEDYVLNCYYQGSLRSKWIPMQRSLTLERLSVAQEEAESTVEVEKLKEMLTEVVEKVVKRQNRHLLTKVQKIHDQLSDDEPKTSSPKKG